MLAPHHREDAELGDARRAPQHLEDAPYSSGAEPMLGDDLGGDLGHALRKVKDRRDGPLLSRRARQGKTAWSVTDRIGDRLTLTARLHEHLREIREAGGENAVKILRLSVAMAAGREGCEVDSAAAVGLAGRATR